MLNYIDQMKGEISMKFNSNKEKGNTGLGIAIAYYRNNNREQVRCPAP